MFPSWFAGFCLASIAIGALVPAAIMSIASGNLFTRNIYKEYVDPQLTTKAEAGVAKAISLAIGVTALLFVLLAPPQYSINLQLLGGIWILQTFPAVVLGLFTRWFRSSALLAGWFVGMITGTAMSVSQHLTAVYPLRIAGITVSAYAALDALLLNLIIASFGSWLASARTPSITDDQTRQEDYELA
jgi:SSS family solute:Na+ symporter